MRIETHLAQYKLPDGRIELFDRVSVVERVPAQRDPGDVVPEGSASRLVATFYPLIPMGEDVDASPAMDAAREYVHAARLVRLL